MTLQEHIESLLLADKLGDAIDVAMAEIKNVDKEIYQLLLVIKPQYLSNETDFATEQIDRKEYRIAKAHIQRGFGKVILMFPENILNKHFADTSAANAPHFLTTTPPRPEFFIGRDEILNQIASQLNDQQPLMLINGVGGIGKSSIALEFANNPQYNAPYTHIAWFVVRDNLLNDFVSAFYRLTPLSSKTTNEQAAEIINHLKTNYTGTNLLIIDNANNADDLEQHYDLLRSVQWAMLITSRANPASYETMRLDELSPEFAKRLFLNHYLRNQKNANLQDFENLADLSNLLKFINYHTLLTELLAKTGNQKPLSIPEIYEMVRRTDLKNPKLQAKINAGQHATLNELERQTALHQYIMKLFEPEKLSEQEQTILRQFSLLPSEEIPVEHLYKMFCKTENEQTEFETTVENLQQSGWLVQNKQFTPQKVTVTYKLHNLVQRVMLEKLKPNAVNCESLVLSLKDIFKHEHLTISHLYTAYADSVVSLLNDNDFSLGALCVYLSDTYATLGQLPTALESIEKAEKIFESIGEKENLVVCIVKIGNIYENLGNIDKATEYRKLEIKYYEDFCEGNPNSEKFKDYLARAYCRFGILQESIGEIDLALENYKKYNNSENELYAKSNSNITYKTELAVSYSKLGEVYSSLGKLDLALENYQEYHRLRKELYEQNPKNESLKNGLAISYSRLGNVYSSLGKLDLAFENYEKFNGLMKELRNENSKNEKIKNDLAISYSNLGDVYSSLGKLDLALENYENMTVLFRELYEQNPKNERLKNGLAASYGKLGEVYSSLGKFDLALDNYQKVFVLYKELYERNPKNESLKRGLSISYEKLGDVYSSLGKLDLALENYLERNRLAKELYEQNLKNVNLFYGLGVSFWKLGDIYNTLENIILSKQYYAEALPIFEKLYEIYKVEKYKKLGRNVEEGNKIETNP